MDVESVITGLKYFIFLNPEAGGLKRRVVFNGKREQKNGRNVTTIDQEILKSGV